MTPRVSAGEPHALHGLPCFLCDGAGFDPDRAGPTGAPACPGCDGQTTRGQFVVDMVSTSGVRAQQGGLCPTYAKARERAQRLALHLRARRMPDWMRGGPRCVQVGYCPPAYGLPLVVAEFPVHPAPTAVAVVAAA